MAMKRERRTAALRGWQKNLVLLGLVGMTTGCSITPAHSDYCAPPTCLYPISKAAELRPDLMKGTKDPMTDGRIATLDPRCTDPEGKCIWLPWGALNEENLPKKPQPLGKPLNLLEEMKAR